MVKLKISESQEKDIPLVITKAQHSSLFRKFCVAYEYTYWEDAAEDFNKLIKKAKAEERKRVLEILKGLKFYEGEDGFDIAQRLHKIINSMREENKC